MTFEETIDAHAHGSLNIDFLSIALEQRRENNPERLAGPGSARQSNDGVIELKCFASGAADDTAFEALGRDTNRKSGQIYKNEDYYDCAAADLSGEVWRTGPTLITRDWSFPQHAGIVHARGVSLCRNAKVRVAQSTLRIHFLKQEHREWRGLVGADAAMRVAAFPFELLITAEEDDRIVVQATSAQPFPSGFERRLVEALQFVMAQTLHVSISDTTSGGERALVLHSPSSRFVARHTLPPLETTHRANRGHLFDLLQRYLEYISSFPDHDIWHSCTNFLALSRDAAGLSLDAWAIGLSVAIEGAANFVNYTAPDMKAEHDSARKLIHKTLADANVSSRLQARVNGMLSQLDHIRPRDRLESLVASGRVLKDDLKNWTQLRNHSVHTREVSAQDFEIAKLQELLNQVQCAVRLLYSVIFHLIDYSGPYTDYAQHFTEQRYPFTPPAPEV